MTDKCETPDCSRPRWCGILSYCAECIIEHHPEVLREMEKISILGPPIDLTEVDGDEITEDLVDAVYDAVHEDDEKPN